jgi:hypothetical protein
MRAMNARLGREMEIWIGTVRADGRPHLTPVWFVWMEEEMRLFIAISANSVKWINLIGNQNAVASLPDTANVLIIEGEAHVAPRATWEVLGDYFYNKYEWDFRYDNSADYRLVEITPHKILAWGDGHDQLGNRIL